MLVGKLGLQPAPAAAVTRQHDAAFDADPLAIEFPVVVRHSLIDVHEFGGHVAVRAIHVVGRQFILGLRRSAVARHRRFGQAGGEMTGRHQFHGDLQRPGLQHRL